jgi:rubrerythrin
MARRDDVDGKADPGVDRHEEDDLVEVELDVTPAELLGSLARLDLEAALAYEAAADASDEAEVAARLIAFAQDHRRHVDGLNALLQASGEAPITPPAGSVLAGVARLAGPLGPDVLVVALLGNEQLTNLSYDGALAYEWDDEVEALLQSYQADEERHLRWLSERHDRIGAHADDAGSPGVE